MSTSPSSNLLSADQLSIGYRTKPQPVVIADGLTLHLPPGQLICLLGANGSGKSTLLRTLAGMQPPLAGGVNLGDQPLEDLTAAHRAQQLAVVLTETVEPRLTVYELVGMGRYPHTSWWGQLTGADRQAIDHALRLTGTQPFAHRTVGSLSDGERQKVMIARAVAQETPLLVLDEPTAHLDVANRTAVLQLLRQLAHEHQRTVLLSTHALELALLMADQLWLMHEGKIHTGVPEDLVLDGLLAKAFDQEGIRFDLQSGSFQVIQPSSAVVGLTGNQPAFFWTKRALERIGYTVVAASEDTPSVKVVTQPLRWTIQYRDDSIEVDSIAQMLTYVSSWLKPT